MKTLEIKSLAIGAVGALSIIALTSNTPNDIKSFEFVSSSEGIGIYSGQTKTLYLYKISNGHLKGKPIQIFKVAEDGASLKEIE